jgi:hypothetical protein
LIPPACFRIATIARESNGGKATIRIVLESIDNELQYLHKSILC